MTLACEDDNSKLAEVVTVDVDVNAEDCVGNILLQFAEVISSRFQDSIDPYDL